MKIRYRLVFNYAARLNADGRAAVSVECRQGQHKVYLSTRVLLYPNQWEKGRVVNHECAAKLTAYLVRQMHRVEEFELDALLHGRQLSLRQLKDAVRMGVSNSATLRDFTQAFLDGDSSRCATTKRSYTYLVNDMEKQFGQLTVSDIDYDLITRYRESMRTKGLSENTVRGRLKSLRCLMEKARLRNIIDRNPFERIVIGNIGGRVGGLTMAEVRRLEDLDLTGRERSVRDLFLLGCYTGLRWGDLSTLDEAEIRNGILTKMMHKTHKTIVLPIGTLFHGKPLQLLDSYPDVVTLCCCCCNTTANKVLKDLAAKAHIKKRVYFHLARKTFSQLLTSMGLPLSDVSILLGHSEVRTTRTHYVFNDSDRLSKEVKKLFR